ncbi:MAG: hypothetical protein ACM3NQ_13485 [Bacteroidales bacterium]
MKLVLPAIVLLIVSGAAAASAGEVKLQIVNGRVTLQARDASAREILDEWARVGQVKVVNADKIAGVPLTLDLQSVPEGQALETVLRSVSGYVAAPRTASSVPGPSIYDRILVMAAPRAAATTAFTSPTPQPQPQYPFRGGPPPGMGAAQFDDQDQPVGQPPVYPGGMPYNMNQPPNARPAGAQPGLSSTPVPNQLPQGAPGTVSPMPTTQPTAPGMQPTQPGLGPAGTITTPPRRPGGPGGPGGEGGQGE